MGSNLSIGGLILLEEMPTICLPLFTQIDFDSLYSASKYNGCKIIFLFSKYNTYF